jgi:hypothetical protein
VLTERALRAVQQLRERGIVFTNTSGRPPFGMRMPVERLGLTMPMAAFNGGVIVLPDLSVLDERLLPEYSTAASVGCSRLFEDKAHEDRVQRPGQVGEMEPVTAGRLRPVGPTAWANATIQWPMPKTDLQNFLRGLYGKQVQPGLTSEGLAVVGHQVPWCGLGLGGRDEQGYANFACARDYERNPGQRNERQPGPGKTIIGDADEILRGTTGSLPVSPKQRVAMKKDTRFSVAPVVVLVLLVLLMLLAVHRRLTVEEAEKTVATVQNRVVRDSYATVAFVGMVALFGYMIWIVLRANQGEAKSMPPTKESSAGDKSAPG